MGRRGVAGEIDAAMEGIDRIMMAERGVLVVAYHYVRDLEATRYPRIKARRTDEFLRQARMLRDGYTPITMDRLLEALDDPAVVLPRNAVLLTFDDGYADHADTVVPILMDLGLQGTFFVPSEPILRQRVMQVNKIHFILAVVDEQELLGMLFDELDAVRETAGLLPNDVLYERHSEPNRYDTRTVIFTKRLLQSVLPQELRTAIVDRWFNDLVTADEAAFARELYMTMTDLRAIRAAGMHVGAHGDSHQWMDSMSPSAQAHEIDCSLDFLAALGCDLDRWTMGYPYGRWNADLVEMLRQRGCRAAFTTVPRNADLGTENALLLPRIDTNDLPT